MKQINKLASKPFWKSKTLWVNICLLLLGISEVIKNNAISPNVIIIASSVNLMLRFISTKQLTFK